MLKAKVLVPAIFLFSVNSFALSAIPLDKMKTFIDKKKPCLLTVAHVAYAKDRVTDACGNQDCVLGSAVWCVNEGIVNEGTINEVKGCMLSSYNTATDKLDRVGGQIYIAQNMSCSKGGFEKLMSLPFAFNGPTVKDFLSKPQPGPMPPIILNSGDSEMVKVIEKAITERKNKK